MNLRNVALLIFLICFSFQSETNSFSSLDENEQIKEQEKIEDNNDNYTIQDFLISLLVLSKLYKNFLYFFYCSPMCI